MNMGKMKLTLLLLAVVLPMAVWSADGDCFQQATIEGVDVWYRVTSEAEKTCSVGWGSDPSSQFYTSTIDANTAGVVTIPAEVNGYKVTQVSSYAFYNCKDITKVILPDPVTTIGYYDATWTESGTDNDANLLVGVTEAADLSSSADGYTNFVLSDGEFRRASSGMLPAHKVYLPLPTQQVGDRESLGIVIENVTTGMATATTIQADETWHSLRGTSLARRPLQRGIYIKRGKKVIVR